MEFWVFLFVGWLVLDPLLWGFIARSERRQRERVLALRRRLDRLVSD